MEKSEVEQTLAEMTKTADDAAIYKAIGSLLVKSDKTKITADLTERKDLLATRSTVITKQEERIRSQVKETQAKLQEEINPTAGQQ